MWNEHGELPARKREVDIKYSDEGEGEGPNVSGRRGGPVETSQRYVARRTEQESGVRRTRRGVR